MKLGISPLAEQDMEAIGDYIAQDNPVRAVSFTEELYRQRQLSPVPAQETPLMLDTGNARPQQAGNHADLHTGQHPGAEGESHGMIPAKSFEFVTSFDDFDSIGASVVTTSRLVSCPTCHASATMAQSNKTFKR